MADNRIALDWGKARIGVAASYGGTQFAFPVETVQAGSCAQERILEIIAEYEAELVYVGLPITLKGERSFSAEFVVGQARQLAARLRPPVRLIDERLSTASASRHLADVGRNQKRSRKVIDQAAAVEILQQALDVEATTGQPAGEVVDVEEP